MKNYFKIVIAIGIIYVLGIVGVYIFSNSIYSNESIFNDKTISEMVIESKNNLLVVLFNLVKYFDKEIRVNDLCKNGICVPQTIFKLTDKQFDGIVGLDDV